jgi:repressor LexA
MEPTARQIEVLRAIHEHQERRGFPISVRDLCDAIGVASTNCGADHIKALLRKGFVEKDEMVARSIRLTQQGVRLLRSFAPKPKDGRTNKQPQQQEESR